MELRRAAPATSACGAVHSSVLNGDPGISRQVQPLRIRIGSATVHCTHFPVLGSWGRGGWRGEPFRRLLILFPRENTLPQKEIVHFMGK